MLEKLDRALHAALRWLCAGLMLAMTLLIFSQVVARYVFHQSLTWSEEIGRYIFVWMSFLGMALAVKAKAHVALDILLKSLRGGGRRVVALVNGACVGVFAAALTYSGLRLLEFGGRQRSAALQLPMDAVYVVIPLSGALLFYFAVRETAAYLKREEEET